MTRNLPATIHYPAAIPLLACALALPGAAKADAVQDAIATGVAQCVDAYRSGESPPELHVAESGTGSWRCTAYAAKGPSDAARTAGDQWAGHGAAAWDVVDVPDIYSRAAPKSAQRVFAICDVEPEPLMVLFSPSGLHLGAPGETPWGVTVSVLGPRAPEFCGGT